MKRRPRVPPPCLTQAERQSEAHQTPHQAACSVAAAQQDPADADQHLFRPRLPRLSWTFLRPRLFAWRTSFPRSQVCQHPPQERHAPAARHGHRQGAADAPAAALDSGCVMHPAQRAKHKRRCGCLVTVGCNQHRGRVWMTGNCGGAAWFGHLATAQAEALSRPLRRFGGDC